MTSVSGISTMDPRRYAVVHASLISENVAKIMLYETGQVISMTSLKSLMDNQYLMKRIISKSASGANPRLIQNQPGTN